MNRNKERNVEENNKTAIEKEIENGIRRQHEHDEEK